MKIIVGDKEGYKINGSMVFHKPLPYEPSEVFIIKFKGVTAGNTGWSPYGNTNTIDTIWFDNKVKNINEKIEYSEGEHTIAIKLLSQYESGADGFGKFIFGENSQANRTGASGLKDIISVSFPNNITTVQNDLFYWWGCNVLLRTGGSEINVIFPSTLTTVGTRFADFSCDSYTQYDKPENVILTSPTKVTCNYAPSGFYSKYSGNKIWVPNNLLSQYQSDNKWTSNGSYTNRIVGYTSIVNGKPVPAV